MTDYKKKIFSITMVKNEADIIESFVRYNVNIFDGMIILDNGSTDTTLKILKLLKSEGLPLFLYEDENKEFDQYNTRNKLLLKAVNEFEADIIVPLDADEFLISTNHKNPRKILEKIKSNTFGIVKWKTYVPDLFENLNKKFIPAKITLARDESFEEFYKVIIPKELVKDYNVRLSLGSHEVNYDQKYENSIKGVQYPNLRICHFPIRSKEQMFSKIVIGWINELHRIDREINESFHWQKIFDIIKEDEEINIEDVVNFAKEYAIFSKEYTINGNVSQIHLYRDPIDTTFCKDLDIIYTNDKVKPISNLLACFEDLSLSHVDFKIKSINNEKRLNEKINNYQNSLSWKITSPLRKISILIRKH